ncbi:hypothetical protein [Geoalkalibacter ferrihydriticus]|uniref:hypothetical protein n=1 Tax=Geoalkalibacter ferrihydriticus TaxID=392333 RepID=UPI001113BD88|nr:hypothetical protein [Geoalkalibacter ferrihydriticus]
MAETPVTSGNLRGEDSNRSVQKGVALTKQANQTPTRVGSPQADQLAAKKNCLRTLLATAGRIIQFGLVKSRGLPFDMYLA